MCVHISADRYLGCFQVLAIINSAAMNIGVHVSLSILVSSVCMPSSVHGIFQARILEWIAIPFSRESSQTRDQTHVSSIAGRFFAI